MASVINIATLEYIPSVNASDYEVGPWLHDPDITSVRGLRRRYWKLHGGSVSRQNQAQRATTRSNLGIVKPPEDEGEE